MAASLLAALAAKAKVSGSPASMHAAQSHSWRDTAAAAHSCGLVDAVFLITPALCVASVWRLCGMGQTRCWWWT